MKSYLLAGSCLKKRKKASYFYALELSVSCVCDTKKACAYIFVSKNKIAP